MFKCIIYSDSFNVKNMNDSECQNSLVRKLVVLTATVSSDTDAIIVKELSQRLSLHKIAPTQFKL